MPHVQHWPAALRDLQHHQEEASGEQRPAGNWTEHKPSWHRTETQPTLSETMRFYQNPAGNRLLSRFPRSGPPRRRAAAASLSPAEQTETWAPSTLGHHSMRLCYGAFPLRGTTRYGTARFGLRFHCSLEWGRLFMCRYSCSTSTATTSS